MWGNTTGWLISAVLTAASLLLGYVVWKQNQPTRASDFAVTAAAPLGAITATATAAGLDGTDRAVNAGAIYRQIAQECEDSGMAYETYQKNHTKTAISDGQKLKGFDLLELAAAGGTMDLYTSRPLEIANYDPKIKTLDDLKAVAGAAMNLVNLEYTAKDYDGAKKLAKAVEILGYNLYKERITFDEMDAAQSLMGQAETMLVLIAKAEKDSATVAQQTAFDDVRKAEFTSKIEPVFEVIKTIGDEVMDAHAGDFFAIAENPKAERMWRVEAVRRIGHLIFNATVKSDQTRAHKFLAKLAADPAEDPIVKAVAGKAKDITPYENQTTR